MNKNIENVNSYTYKDGGLIYDLMMDSFVPDYVDSLPYGIGKKVRKEFYHNTACGKIFKNLHKLEEDIQTWMGLEPEEGDIYIFIESFYTLLNKTTSYSYEISLKDIKLENWLGLDEIIAEMQKANIEMMKAYLNIKKALDAEKAKTVDALLTECEKLLLIFPQLASEYGDYFKFIIKGKE